MHNVLITGGAGFIGSHLADELISCGYHVRLLDNLLPQVHGKRQRKPSFLNPQAQFMRGDIRDRQTLEKALEDIDAVFHFAASVGVGQSMYEIENYISNNSYGTSVLCQCLIDSHPVKKLIVASSMSIYGEGMYLDQEDQLVTNAKRSVDKIKKGQWEPTDTHGKALLPIATAETKIPDLSSIYALSKYEQERMCLITSKAYNIPAVALRFFNVFGTRQALSNPYTGVLAIFASRLLNDNRPLIFEDGNQKRDFVSVHDVVRACRLALENSHIRNDVFNIGSGRVYTVRQVAWMLAKILGKDISPVITGKYRAGDIRHCFADISRAKETLGYSPMVSLEEGLDELTDWLKTQAARDSSEQAHNILEQRGLTI